MKSFPLLCIFGAYCLNFSVAGYYSKCCGDAEEVLGVVRCRLWRENTFLKKLKLILSFCEKRKNKLCVSRTEADAEQELTISTSTKV